MEFESPDVEKDFPGLYASETVRKCNESDSSDESHDKSFKKDLIIGKRKEKKDSKKDRGYATLEGESSPDEDLDSRSPCKSKKSKSFKFPTKKSEKREKSREKDAEKKDKEKKEKEKVKHKDKKKVKGGDDVSDATEDFPIFGVDLAVAVERNGCLDGVPIPLVVRNCIDCIHSFGIHMDGLYKVAGVKSKVQTFKKGYNSREPVSMGECDVSVASCLLKLFLRDLPEPILTKELLARFEEAGAIMEVDARERELENLLTQLPLQNRVLLGYLIVHFDMVTMHEKQNKLNAQSIAMTFSPILQMSHRLLTAFLCHCKALFSDIVIERYIPPLCPGSSFPEKFDEIIVELKKQECLLSQIHKEVSEGFVSKKKEEQLWEVQRIVTQLKRKLKGLQRFQEASFPQKSLEEEHCVSEDNMPKKQSVEKNNSQSKQKDSKENSVEKIQEEEMTQSTVESKCSDKLSEEGTETDKLGGKQTQTESVVKPIKKERNLEELREELEYEELLKFHNSLQERIDKEKELISKLNAEIHSCSSHKSNSPVEGNESFGIKSELEVNVEKLAKDYHKLQTKVSNLALKIFEERLACVRLKAHINILEMPEQ